MKPQFLLAFLATLTVTSLSLSACESSESKPDTAAPASAADSSATSAPPTTTPSPATTPTAATTAPADPAITVTCSTSGGPVTFAIDRVNPDWKKIWSTPLKPDTKLGILNCDGKVGDTGQKLAPVSPAEQAIWDRAGHGRDTLIYAYTGCVEHDDPWYLNRYPLSGGQADEARTMLLLCPRHPNSAAIRKRAGIQDEFQQQIANGETINDGTWRAGKDVKPGTYTMTTPAAGLECFWARHNSSGTAVQSGTVGGGRIKQVSVTIAASDYDFYTENCGVWFRIK